MDMEISVEVLAYIFIVGLGLCVGSFVNVLVLRHGYRERPNPRSACAACHHQLGALDLVPVFSYLLLQGRCKHCGSRISSQYIFVEVLVAALFAVTYYTLAPVSVLEYIAAASYAAAWAALTAIVVYDIRHTLVPMPFVYALYAAAVARVGADAYGFMDPVGFGLDALLGAVTIGGFFAVISLVTRGRGMGIGDAYIAAGIGALLGLPGAILAATLAAWTGAAYGLMGIAVKQLFPRMRIVGLSERATLKAELPFAPFLMLGAVVVFITGWTLSSLGLPSLL